MKKLLFLLFICITFYNGRSQCLASTNPTNDCSGGAAISFINIANVATYPGGCITSDGYYYNANAPYGFMIGASINYTINCPISLGVAMWIDLNNNGILSNNEMLITSSPKTLHIGTFTVPRTANPFPSGKIRFRSAWNHQITGNEACLNDLGGAGDTQDYLISLFCGTLSVPATTITPAAPTICKGDNITLYATGANNYTWSPSNANTNTLNVAPTVNTTYTVTASNTNCPGTSKKLVQVKISNPIVNVSASSTMMCVGDSHTFSASGADTYTWSTEQHGAEIIITPTVSGLQNYTVTGIANSFCKNSAVFTIDAQECVGIRKYETETNGFLFFPNPVKYAITIKSDIRQNLEIINASGQVVKKFTVAGTQDIFVKDLEAGVYFIRSSDDPLVSGKFVVVD